MAWAEEIGDEQVEVDAGMLASVFQELLTNARRFCEGAPATASVRREADVVMFELREPKAGLVDPTGWSRRIFESTKRGGYGLGLWHAQRLATASGAMLTQSGADGALVTRIAIPVASAQ